jgi:hypothetical protein
VPFITTLLVPLLMVSRLPAVPLRAGAVAEAEAEAEAEAPGAAGAEDDDGDGVAPAAGAEDPPPTGESATEVRVSAAHPVSSSALPVTAAVSATAAVR